MQVVTDGEFRRGSYWGRFVERIDGFDDQAGIVQVPRRSRPRGRFHRALCRRQAQARAAAGARRIRFPARCRQGDGQDHAAGALDHAFLPLQRFCRPAVYARCRARSLPTSPQVFRAGDRRARASRLPLYPARRGRGGPAVRSGASASRSRPSGSDPDALVDLYIEGINQAVADAPADVLVGVHMCRGNFKGHYLGAGGYESVAERFFAQHQCQPFPAGIRHAARRRFRAAALRAEDEGRRARPDQHENAGA